MVPTLSVPTPAAPAQAGQFRVLLDERFSSPTLPWRSVAGGTTWLADGVYHLATRQPTRFVAVGVPGATDVQDVVLSATFRKLGGPTGGGYGLIVRDQAAAEARDGESQAGRFYVFEVGDSGELGVWLRDGERWLDLLPWTRSDAIKPGLATNELTVSAIGDTLSFAINGIPVASQRDTMLHRGGLGVFVGGDGNSVGVDRVTARVPR